MKATEILNQIKEVLGIELSEEKVQLESMKLDNGTEITSENFEKGSDVFIKGEEGESIPLPEGEYTLEDSRVLVVKNEGVIDEIKEAAEEEAPAEETEEVEAAEVETEEVEAAEDEKEYATKQELEEVKTMIDELKSILEKEDLSKEEETKEVEQVEEIEMSSEEVEPIAHNPEMLASHQNNQHQNVSLHLSRIRQMIYNNN